MGKIPNINIKSDFIHICFSNDLHVLIYLQAMKSVYNVKHLDPPENGESKFNRLTLSKAICQGSVEWSTEVIYSALLSLSLI